ncbi:MAG: hypothetical protein L0G99_01765 [Propionibacteriales bacterium]|nr:hypothetical protein [Propionibacteriales bacterium]
MSSTFGSFIGDPETVMLSRLSDFVTGFADEDEALGLGEALVLPLDEGVAVGAAETRGVPFGGAASSGVDWQAAVSVTASTATKLRNCATRR